MPITSPHPVRMMTRDLDVEDELAKQKDSIDLEDEIDWEAEAERMKAEEKVKARLAAKALVEAKKLLKVPVRVWTGGPGSPQDIILIPGEMYGVRPGADGSYVLRTQQQVDIAKRALGNRWWVDDVPEGVPSPKCEGCGWTTRSYQAYIWHGNNAHGRPQGSG